MKQTLYGYFFEKYDAVAPVYPQILKVEDSEAAYEQSTSVIGMGELRETPEGESIIYRSPEEGFTTYGINRDFTDGIKIHRNVIDDHQKVDNILRAAAQSWGDSVVWTLEKFFAKLFNNGGLTAGSDIFKNVISGVISANTDSLCYDNKPLFNLSGNTRSSKGGGTYYNGFASALTHANLKTVWLHMTSTNNRNEQDEIISLVPDILLVPPALYLDALQYLQSTQIPGSANNDKNVLANIVTPVKWDYLTDTDAWFLGKKQYGLVAQRRKTPVIDFYFDEDDQYYKANIVMRYGARVDNWRFWVGSNFSTS